MDHFDKTMIARELAWEIICSGDTDVSVQQLNAWKTHELYGWLKKCSYEWDGAEWSHHLSTSACQRWR